MVIPVDYAQANFRYSGSGVPTGAEWTLGLNVELYAGDPVACAEDLALEYATANIETLFSSSVVLDSVLVKYGPDATGPSGVFDVNIPGTQSAAAAPPNTAVLVRKNTAFGGRTGRGRLYIPGPADADVNEAGTWASVNVTALDTAFEAFRVALVGLGLIPTLLHGAGSPVSAPLPIVGFSTDSKVATQRRRLRR